MGLDPVFPAVVACSPPATVGERGGGGGGGGGGGDGAHRRALSATRGIATTVSGQQVVCGGARRNKAITPRVVSDAFPRGCGRTQALRKRSVPGV